LRIENILLKPEKLEFYDDKDLQKILDSKGSKRERLRKELIGSLQRRFNRRDKTQEIT
jgi:hypothetical protein